MTENKKSEYCEMLCGIVLGMGIQALLILGVNFLAYQSIISLSIAIVITCVLQFLILFLTAAILTEDSRIIRKCDRFNGMGILGNTTIFSIGFFAFAVISLITDNITQEVSDPFITKYLPMFQNTPVKGIIIIFAALFFSVLLAEFSNKLNQLNRLKEQQTPPQSQAQPNSTQTPKP